MVTAADLDPNNPESIQQLLGSGMLEPEETPEQQMALRRLETLLALVEGWVDVVVADAVGERLPGASALGETLRRRRASGGPAEQTFATLVGLELRPRRLRDAAALWRALTDERGIEGRDAVWSHPDLMPTADDLDDPAAFVGGTKTVGTGQAEGSAESFTDLDDPLARLEAEMKAEQEAKDANAKDAEKDEPGEGDGPSSP